MYFRWLLIVLLIACGNTTVKFPIKELERRDKIQPKPVIAPVPKYGNKIV